MTRHVLSATIAVALVLGSVPARAERVRHVRLGQRHHSSGSERIWVDDQGVKHITLGPSAEARARAQRLSLIPESGGDRAERVRDARDWDGFIAQAASKYNIPEELVRAVIVAESNFNPNAISPAGAHGLMQLMPGTGAAMFVENLHDPAQNIFGGTRYLRILANMFDGDLIKTIAAYNAGPQAVRRANGIPGIAETQEYVRRVIKLYRIYKGVA